MTPTSHVARPSRAARSGCACGRCPRSAGRSANASAPMTACATCGSRARSGGSRSRPPATPTSRSRTPARSSSACGSAMTGRGRRSSRRPGSRSSPTGGWTCSSRRARCSCTSSRSSRPGSATSRSGSSSSRPRSPRRACSTPARKRPLPRQPRTIAVITSPTGAVWRDVCTVLARRWPMTRVVLVACQVQGDGAPASIVTAFRRLERWIGELDADGRGDEAPAVTILARGGGSLEDLWSFNDERVVRAVVAHPIPVVCGVGHEVDVTLADFAADVRAPTPSAAAELVVPDRIEVAASVATLGRRAEAASMRRMSVARRELDAERRALDRLGPRAQLAASRERAGLLLDRAARVVSERLAAAPAWPGAAGSAAAARPARPPRPRGAPGGRARAAGAARRPAAPRDRNDVARGDAGVARRARAPGDARPRLRDRPAGSRRRDRAQARRCARRHAAQPCARRWHGSPRPATGPRPRIGEGSRGERGRPRLGLPVPRDRRAVRHRRRRRRYDRGRTDRPAHGAATPPAPRRCRLPTSPAPSGQEDPS